MRAVLPLLYRNPVQKELQEKLAKLYRVKDANIVFVFGMKTQVGAGECRGVWRAGACGHVLSREPRPLAHTACCSRGCSLVAASPLALG